MPQAKADPDKDLWMQTALSIGADLFPPLVPVAFVASHVDVGAVVRLMIELKDIVGSIVHHVQQAAVNLKDNFLVCESKRLTGIVSCVALATSGLSFMAALTATAVPPATIVGIPSTIVTGIAFGASIVAVINNIIALNACLDDEVNKLRKELADKQKESQRTHELEDIERRLDELERHQKPVRATEQGLRGDKRRFDAVVEQLKHAHH